MTDISKSASLSKTGLKHRISRQAKKITKRLSRFFPKKLFPRTILIIIAPLVILQVILTFVFMERHWERVTRRLSVGTVNNIAALIRAYEEFPGDKQRDKLIRIAREELSMQVQLLPLGNLPQDAPKPFFDILDHVLGEQIKERLQRPYWIDTVGRSEHVEIRIKLKDAIFRVITQRNQTYASNSHIFLVWMVGSSTILLLISLIFLRNQIRPIVALSKAAEAFGKGRSVSEDFTPRGAHEIREAAIAFIKMRDRIERHVDQRTTMLAGVSHDLRTVLTRLTLEVELMDDEKATKAMRSDITEMSNMLEDYLAFAKGAGKEKNISIHIEKLLHEIVNDNQRMGTKIDLDLPSNVPMYFVARRNALKRAINNLASNAGRLADHVRLSVRHKGNRLYFTIDDDGPGIPEEQREQVFHPFFRLDQARNQNRGNTGLGLAITRDIIHTHGGDIHLKESPMGGLRAQFYIPV